MNYREQYLAHAIRHRNMARTLRHGALHQFFRECMHYWAVLAVKQPKRKDR